MDNKQTQNNNCNPQGIIQNENKNIVTISMPQSVVDAVNVAMIGKTHLARAKAYFLTWLINRGDRIEGQNTFNANQYQLHIRAHRQVFTTADEVEKLRDILLSANVIKTVAGYSVENHKAKTYAVSSPWKLRNADNQLIHFDINKYGFAANFQAVGYLILPNQGKIKAENKALQQNTAVDNNEINNLKNTLEMMQKQIEQMQMQIDMMTLQSILHSAEVEIEVGDVQVDNTPTTIEVNPSIKENRDRIIDAYIAQGIKEADTLYYTAYAQFVTDDCTEQQIEEIVDYLLDTIEVKLKG